MTGGARDWWTLAGVAVVAVGAIVASFTAQAGLGDLAGWHASVDIGVEVRLSWLLPLCVDAYGVTATRIAVSDRLSEHTRHHALIHAVGAVVASVLANAVYHALQAEVLTLGGARWVLVVAVSIIPPVALGALAHLMALCARDDAARSRPLTPPEPVQPVQPVQVEALPRTPPGTAVASRTPQAHTSAVVDLASVRARPARTRPQLTAAPGAPRVDRAAFIAELAGQIRHAEGEGRRWWPDYPALEARTGYRRSWCQKAVREARALAAAAQDTPPPADLDAADDVSAEADEDVAE